MERFYFFIGRIVALLGSLYLHVVRFKAIGFKYGLCCVWLNFSVKLSQFRIIFKIAILFGVFTVFLIFFMFGSLTYAMENDETIFAEPPKLKFIANALLIDLQRAKFRIVPYSVVQENDPKFFKHVLNTSNSLSFNGRYIGVSYPYSKDPVKVFVRNVILDDGRFERCEAVKLGIFSRSAYLDNKVVRFILNQYGLAEDLRVNNSAFSEKMRDFFFNTKGSRLNLNRLLVNHAYVTGVSNCMYTFVEYLQGTKFLNDKIFTFSHRTKFNMRPLADTSFDNQFKNINLGLYLNETNISLVFKNTILYNENGKFDFNLLRAELLKAEVICDTIKVFSIERIDGDVFKLIERFNKIYGYVRGNTFRTVSFTFRPADYHLHDSLAITSINFTFNDEDTLD